MTDWSADETSSRWRKRRSGAGPPRCSCGSSRQPPGSWRSWSARLVQALRIPVLVNDRPDVAIAAGAAGVHLGPDDMPVGLARRIAPPGFVVGASVGSEAEAATAGDADYWGIGPWRATPTKEDAGIGLGADGFGRLRRLAGGRPVLAIGGVTPEDVPADPRAGGKGVAVVSGILGAEDVEAAARRYAEAAGQRGSG